MDFKSINKTEVNERPEIIEELEIEELAIDGICGVYQQRKLVLS